MPAVSVAIEAFTRQDLVEQVRHVLEEARRGKGDEPWFVTSYQILARLPRPMRDWLVARHGRPGEGSGHHHSAAQQVAHIAARMVGEENKAYLDSGNVLFDVKLGEPIRAGFELCAIFRLPSPSEKLRDGASEEGPPLQPELPLPGL